MLPNVISLAARDAAGTKSILVRVSVDGSMLVVLVGIRNAVYTVCNCTERRTLGLLSWTDRGGTIA